MSGGPTNSSGGNYITLEEAPKPFLHGYSLTNSDGGSMTGAQVAVPLLGPTSAPAIVEGVTWFPADSEDPIVPFFTSTNPAPGIWTGANWYVMLNENGGDFGTWEGGYLLLQGSGTRR